MKILVVFAGKWRRRCLQPIHFAHEPGGLGFRHTMGDACFKRHASNFICKGATASTAPQESSDSSLASGEPRDRKSTRLNSSHGYISYAVFCLKKKKQRIVAFC